MITFPEPLICETLNPPGSPLHMPSYTSQSPLCFGAVDVAPRSHLRAHFSTSLLAPTITGQGVTGNRLCNGNVHAEVYGNMLVENGIHQTEKVNVIWLRQEAQQSPRRVLESTALQSCPALGQGGQVFAPFSLVAASGLFWGSGWLWVKPFLGRFSADSHQKTAILAAGGQAPGF